MPGSGLFQLSHKEDTLFSIFTLLKVKGTRSIDTSTGIELPSVLNGQISSRSLAE